MRLKGDVRETILSKRFTLIRDKKGSFKRGCLYLPVLLLLSGGFIISNEGLTINLLIALFQHQWIFYHILLFRCLKIELAVLNNGREFPTIPGMIGSVENLSVLSRHVSWCGISSGTWTFSWSWHWQRDVRCSVHFVYIY